MSWVAETYPDEMGEAGFESDESDESDRDDIGRAKPNTSAINTQEFIQIDNKNAELSNNNQSQVSGLQQQYIFILISHLLLLLQPLSYPLFVLSRPSGMILLPPKVLHDIRCCNIRYYQK